MNKPANTSATCKSDGLWTGTGKGPLAGIRVVDFGQYLAGPLLGMLLADQGADVIRVDPPRGPRWDTPVNAVLLRGRRNITLDLKQAGDRARARAMIASADVLIENFRPGVADRLGIGPSDCSAIAPQLVYCSLPGFARADPRAGIAAWEGVIMAAGGGYALPKRGTEFSAAFSPLPLASVFGAIEGAAGVVAALIARERDGLGQQVEVALCDALLEACGIHNMAMERPNDAWVDMPLGWYRCSDGRYINLCSTWLKHFEVFASAAGKGEWIDQGLFDFERLKSDPQAGPALRARFVELFAERPALEWEALGRACGASLAMARSMAEWMAEPHATASGVLVDVADPVLGSARVPGLAVKCSTGSGGVAQPRSRPGEADAAILPLLDAIGEPERGEPVAPSRSAPPLAGLRVVDFTRVAAGPTGGRILAQFGADVVKVDTSTDDQRTIVSLPLQHEYVNRGKRSIDVDLHDPAQAPVLAGLIDGADAVLQHFTASAAERLGIDAVAVRQRNPDAVYAYLNCFGTQGPWAGARGFAEIANTATGLTERTIGDKPIASGKHSLAFDLPRWFFTDYGVGALAAFGVLLGLYERGRTGQAPFVETALVRMTALQQVIYMIDYPGRDIAEPRGPQRGWSWLQSLYDTADGIIFIGAREDQRDALLRAVGAVDEAGLAEAIGVFSGDEAVEALVGAGVGAHAVVTTAHVLEPGGTADRRGLRVTDLTSAFGQVVMSGPVAQLSRTPSTAGAFVTPLGAETAELRAEALERLAVAT